MLCSMRAQSAWQVPSQGSGRFCAHPCALTPRTSRCGQERGSRGSKERSGLSAFAVGGLLFCSWSWSRRCAFPCSAHKGLLLWAVSEVVWVLSDSLKVRQPFVSHIEFYMLWPRSKLTNIIIDCDCLLLASGRLATLCEQNSFVKNPLSVKDII